MKVLKITPGCEMSLVEVPKNELLQTLQEQVDGWIEIVRPVGLGRINALFKEAYGENLSAVMVVDDDFIHKEKEVNPIGSKLYHGYIAGNIIICKEIFKENIGYDLEGFSEKETTKLLRLFNFLFKKEI